MEQGGGGESDGIIVLGKMDVWVCGARYHAKQHERWRRKQINKCVKTKQKGNPNKTKALASAREQNQKLMSLKPNGQKFIQLRLWAQSPCTKNKQTNKQREIQLTLLKRLILGLQKTTISSQEYKKQKCLHKKTIQQ